MKTKILVVDDDITILRLLDFILSKDYELVFKSSGLEAMFWLDEGNTPALAICDLEMPDIDGQTLIRNIKISGFHRDIPVIVLSGTTGLSEVIKNMDFRIEGFVEKPFSPGKLKATIENVLNAKTIAA